MPQKVPQIEFAKESRPSLEGISISKLKFFSEEDRKDLETISGWKYLAQLARDFPTHLYESPSGKWFVVRVQGGKIENAFRRIPGIKFLFGGPVNSGVTKRAVKLWKTGLDVERPVAEFRGRQILNNVPGRRGFVRKIHITEYVGETSFPYLKNTLKSYLSSEPVAAKRENAVRLVARFVASAHNRGVTHNDLYGRNVMYFDKPQRVAYIDPETWRVGNPKSALSQRIASRDFETFLAELREIERIYHNSGSDRLEAAFRAEYSKARKKQIY